MRKYWGHFLVLIFISGLGMFQYYGVITLLVIQCLLLDVFTSKLRDSNKDNVKVVIGISVLAIITCFLLENPREQIIALFSLLMFMGTQRAKLQDENNSKVGVFLLTLTMLAMSLWPLNFHLSSLSLGLPVKGVTFLALSATIHSILLVIFHTKRVERRLVEGAEQGKELNWMNTLVNLISHNVRTPLAILLSNLELVKMKLNNSAHEDIATELERMGIAVESSVEIMNRLLRASSLGQEDGYAGIDGIEARIKKAYPGIEVEKSPVLVQFSQANTIAIIMALEVFLDNAMTHGGSEIRVSFLNDKISVLDNGAGISEENMALFGKPAASQDAKGNVHGIGVAFAVRLLDAVNWSVKACNTKEGFCVDLLPVSISA